MKNTAHLSHVCPLLLTGLVLGLSLGGTIPATAMEPEARLVNEAEQSSDAASAVSEFSESTAIELEVSGVSDLGFEGSGAAIELLSQGVEIELPWFSLSGNFYEFTWEGAEDLSFSNGSAKPWDDLSRFEVRYDFHQPVSEDWAWIASLGGGVAFEEEISGSGYINTVLGASWNRSEDWGLFFGVGYNWHTTVDVEYELFPVFGVSYRERAEQGWSASLGLPQTGVRYRFASGAAISLTANVQSFVAKLAEDSEVASEGFAEFLRFDIGLNYEQSFGDRVALKVGPTFGFGSELKLHNSVGQLLSEHDLEASPGFSLQMGVTF
ncbi:MAG: hypothetical protein AAGD01_12040 [Acidobacteriota bacterium]